jgi:hypothetical protein
MKNWPLATSHFLAIIFAFLILATSAFGGPVSHFGALKVCGNNICGEKTGNQTPIFFKGPSLFWSDGEGAPYYKQEVVDWFVDNMQIGVIRAAMAIRYYGNNTETVNKPGGVWGYYFEPATQKSLIKTVIDAAIANDIYVIVDWHSHNAHDETSSATAFFSGLAAEYPGVPNIIWEVYNEPINASNAQITSHANSIITALRNVGNNNLVLVGSPNYSKAPGAQAGNFGSTAASKNVAFTFHFYAASHSFTNDGDNIKSSTQGARTNGYAVFGTEWGAVNYDGDGGVDQTQSNNWTTWMDDNKVSNCMWNASAAKKSNGNEVQGSSMFKLNTNPGTISTSDLTSGSGSYFQTYMGKNKWTAQIPSNHPKANDVIATVADGSSVTLNATTLGLTGDITEVGSVPFGDLSISADKKSIIYQTSDRGSPETFVRFVYKVTKDNITIQNKAIINITNRRPILPEKAPIAVSRRAAVYLPLMGATARSLSASDPSGTGIEFTQVSLSPSNVGTVTITPQFKDSIVFTPASSLYDAGLTQATLNYTVKTKGGNASNSASVVLNIQNMAPTITPVTNTTCCSLNGRPNTEPVGLGIRNFNGRDDDGDSIWFDTIYLAPQYPGSINRVAPDSFVYYPAAGRTGKVAFLAIVTDGHSLSNVGRANLTLTGSGTEINVTAPTEIPGISPVIPRSAGSGALGLNFSSGRVELYFAQSGFAKLDVYSLSGKNMGTLLNGHQNAGPKELSLKNLNLQKGVYILRLRQGSQIKTVRIVN